MPLYDHAADRFVANSMKRPSTRHKVGPSIPLQVLVVLLVLFVSSAQAGGTAPKIPNPGFRSVGLWDQTIPLRMDIAVWYPSSRLPKELSLEEWSLLVARNGSAVPGKYPVILLSHTMAASRLASHDLAAALARNGFMVIAPTHPTDNTDDTSGVFHAALFANRPKHLLMALAAVEQSTILGPLMDRSRIGVLGVGAGAATALQLAGALPDLSRLSEICPETENGNPLCSQWAKAFHPRIQSEFATLLADGPQIFTPVIHRNMEPLAIDDTLSVQADNNTVLDSGEGSTPTPKSPTVQPILAIGLLTPGLVDLFQDTSLQTLTSPVGVLAVSNDTVYPMEKSLTRLQQLLPQRPASRIIEHASHFDVQPPCSTTVLESFTALCGNQNPEADASRQLRNEFFVRFFQKNLGLPIPPPSSIDRPS